MSSVQDWLKENESEKANILKGKLKVLEEICKPLTYPLVFSLPTLEDINTNNIMLFCSVTTIYNIFGLNSIVQVVTKYF